MEPSTTIAVHKSTSYKLDEISDAYAGASKKQLAEIAVQRLYDEIADEDGELTTLSEEFL